MKINRVKTDTFTGVKKINSKSFWREKQIMSRGKKKRKEIRVSDFSSPTPDARRQCNIMLNVLMEITFNIEGYRQSHYPSVVKVK